MYEKKTWEEFRKTGLVFLINMILQVFGWSIVFEVEQENDEVKDVYPVRTKYRGFDEATTISSYEKITAHMVECVQNMDISSDN